MNISHRWTRSAGALAAAAAVVSTAATAGAAPVRTATTTGYTTTTYLQHALDLPTTDTTPAIEPVTYDRFQWLLQQPGDFAVLIGDPATDATFKARARDVEVAALAADVKKVYWFDPNLSGNAQVGSTTEPNLDIRDPDGITSLDPASHAKYGNAWTNLVGKYLGNGLSVTQAGLNSENATVTVLPAAVVNDNGATDGHSTEVGDVHGGALYDYTGGTAPANAGHSFFFIYNKDHADGGAAAKIVAWTDLTSPAVDSDTTKAHVADAIGAVTGGGANVAEADQFAWWKDEVNAKQATQAPAVSDGGNVPVLTDADKADGWRINQITYPELVDLLKSDTDHDAVILFGGTWCPNTRPVLPSINKYAQQNDVQVFNFDTVLDGGLVGGSTTSATDPLQTRNTLGTNAAATVTINPSFLYGDLVSQYLDNIKTQYVPTTNSTVTYYPNGGTSSTLTRINKLQVPFVIGYQGSTSPDPHGGVTRQWIIDKGNGQYTEYMSQWRLTNPQPNQLGLTIPLDAPIWSTINAQVADFTWQTDPSTLYPNTASDTDDAQYLVAADTATVTYTAPSSVSVSAGGSSPITISPAALSAALSAVGTPAPANLSAAKAAYVAALNASSPLTADLKTIVGAWGVAQTRKNSVINAWGNATDPGTVAGGVAAVHALDVFFGGLPGGVVSHRSVTAGPVAHGAAPKITIAIANDYGRVPTGNVALTVSRGGTTVASASAAVAQDAASFTLPVLDTGTYDYTLSYPGDDQLLAFTENGSFTVAAADAVVPPGVTPPVVPGVPNAPAVPKAPAVPTRVAKKTKAGKIKGAVSKGPTSRKSGKYKVTITTPKGRTAASGKVTIKLKKGKTTKTVTGRLVRGTLTVTLPKLARGTWKVTISWPGDAHYLKASVTGVSIKVIK
ncbi:MAG TPA: Ig-like domain repeat protein [Baekduia sp.]